MQKALVVTAKIKDLQIKAESLFNDGEQEEANKLLGQVEGLMKHRETIETNMKRATPAQPEESIEKKAKRQQLDILQREIVEKESRIQLLIDNQVKPKVVTKEMNALKPKKALADQLRK